MAEYGIFTTSGGMTALRKYQGDLMERNGEYVDIFTLSNDQQTKELVTSIRLDKNQTVRKIPSKTSGA
jgi:hypothetical protein